MGFIERMWCRCLVEGYHLAFPSLDKLACNKTGNFNTCAPGSLSSRHMYMQCAAWQYTRDSGVDMSSTTVFCLKSRANDVSTHKSLRASIVRLTQPAIVCAMSLESYVAERERRKESRAGAHASARL